MSNVSVTKLTGAVSTIITSYRFFKDRNKFSTLLVNNSSAGFGGIAPDTMTSAPLTSGNGNMRSSKVNFSF